MFRKWLRSGCVHQNTSLTRNTWVPRKPKERKYTIYKYSSEYLWHFMTSYDPLPLAVSEWSHLQIGHHKPFILRVRLHSAFESDVFPFASSIPRLRTPASADANGTWKAELPVEPVQHGSAGKTSIRGCKSLIVMNQILIHFMNFHHTSLLHPSKEICKFVFAGTHQGSGKGRYPRAKLAALLPEFQCNFSCKCRITWQDLYPVKKKHQEVELTNPTPRAE